MKNGLRNALVYLATGYVLYFASERIFWSAIRPGDHVGDLVVTWLAYSVIACVFLNVVSRFQADSAATVFLAGALYGWLVEGTLVGTLYGTESSAPFPMSIVWTGLSWHALISVLIGWHFIGQGLREPTPWKAIAWSVGLGVYWGAWAPFLWREEPPQVASVSAFATHALVCTALLMLSHAVLLRHSRGSFQPGWLGLGFSLLVLIVFFSAQVKALGVQPLLVLPSLIGLTLALLRGPRRDAPAAFKESEVRPVKPRQLLALLGLPAAAVNLYALQLAWGVKGIAPILFYRVGGILSIGILAWAVFHVVRGHSTATTPPKSE